MIEEITINDKFQNPITFDVIYSAEHVEIDDHFGTQDHGIDIEILEIYSHETGKNKHHESIPEYIKHELEKEIINNINS